MKTFTVKSDGQIFEIQADRMDWMLEPERMICFFIGDKTIAMFREWASVIEHVE